MLRDQSDKSKSMLTTHHCQLQWISDKTYNTIMRILYLQGKSVGIRARHDLQ